jgi:hypothetical protein
MGKRTDIPLQCLLIALQAGRTHALNEAEQYDAEDLICNWG